MNRPVCVVAGVGPGNGAALARRFAANGYSVALLARTAEYVDHLATQVEHSFPYICDLADEDSIATTFAAIKREMGDCETLVYNAGGAVWGDLTQISAADMEACWRINVQGLFLCAKLTVPEMRAGGSGRILITGATASWRGGAKTAAFASSKAAQRSLAQSLARQLGPQGIHVAYFIIDGVVDLPRTRERMPDQPDEFFLQPEAIAESYWHIHQQPKSAWTFEMDLRPYRENW